MALVCVLLAPTPLNVMDCESFLFEAIEHFVVLTAALPLNPSPPSKATEHASPTTPSAAVATSPTFTGADPIRRLVKLRGTARTMIALTALHDGEHVPLASASKLPPLPPVQVPGWIVTVVLLDPDVYP